MLIDEKQREIVLTQDNLIFSDWDGFLHITTSLHWQCNELHGPDFVRCWRL